jgi:hypothetical protein
MLSCWYGRSYVKRCGNYSICFYKTRTDPDVPYIVVGVKN